MRSKRALTISSQSPRLIHTASKNTLERCEAEPQAIFLGQRAAHAKWSHRDLGWWAGEIRISANCKSTRATAFAFFLQPIAAFLTKVYKVALNKGLIRPLCIKRPPGPRALLPSQVLQNHGVGPQATKLQKAEHKKHNLCDKRT